MCAARCPSTARPSTTSSAACSPASTPRHATSHHAISRPPALDCSRDCSLDTRSLFTHSLCSLYGVRCTVYAKRARYARWAEHSMRSCSMLMCFSLSSRAQPVHTSTSLASARALGTLEPADSCVSFDVLYSHVLVHDYSRRALAPLTLGISWPSHLSRASRAA